MNFARRFEVGGLLDSPPIKAELVNAAVATLDDPKVKSVFRSYLLEAAAYVGGAVLLAVVLGRRL